MQKCGGKAFKGRIAIFEMLEMSDELEKIILGSISEAALRQEAKKARNDNHVPGRNFESVEGVVSLEELLEIAQAGDSA